MIVSPEIAVKIKAKVSEVSMFLDGDKKLNFIFNSIEDLATMADRVALMDWFVETYEILKQIQNSESSE